MSVINGLIKYGGGEIAKATENSIQKGVQKAAISAMNKTANKLATDVITKNGASLVNKLLTPETIRTNWNGAKDIESMLDGKFLGTNDEFFNSKFSQGALSRADYANMPYDQKKVAGLVRAIRNNEDIAPIAGVMNEDGAIEVYDGHHRLAAFKKAGKMPRVKIFEPSQKSEAYTFADDWAKNVSKKVDKYLPQTKNKQYGLDEYGMGRIDLSDINSMPKTNMSAIETPQLPFVDMPKDTMANSMLQGEFHENPEIQQMRSLDELLGYDYFPKDRQELRTAVIDALANRDTDDLTAKEILSQTPLLTRIFSNEQQLSDQIGSGRLSSVSLASPSMLRYKDLVNFYGGDKPIITVLDVPEATRNGIYLDEGDLNTPTDFDKRRSVDEHNKLMEQYLDDYGIEKYDFGGFNDESWKDADWYMRTKNGRTSSGYAEGVADLGKNSIALRTNSIKQDDDMLNDLMDMIIEKARGENGREWLERIIPGSTEVLEKYIGDPVNMSVYDGYRSGYGGFANDVKSIGNSNVAPIDKSTLPENYEFFSDLTKKNKAKYGWVYDAVSKETGKPASRITNADLKKYLEDYYPDYVSDGKMTKYDLEKSINDAMEDEMTDLGYENSADLSVVVHNRPGNAGIRDLYNDHSGRTGRIDRELSKRLGIGESTSVMADKLLRAGYGDAAGDATGNMMGIDYGSWYGDNDETNLGTVAHERMHLMQDAANGFDYEQVQPAYNELHDELQKAMLNEDELRKAHSNFDRKGMGYWGNYKEQEARMLEAYLYDEGYTKARPIREEEFRDKMDIIKPAFDKFFNKLRELSKKGVALPAVAIASLFGLNKENDEESVDNIQ